MTYLELLRRVRFVRDSIRHLQGVGVRRVSLARTVNGGVTAHLYLTDDRVAIVTFKK